MKRYIKISILLLFTLILFSLIYIASVCLPNVSGLDQVIQHAEPENRLDSVGVRDFIELANEGSSTEGQIARWLLLKSMFDRKYSNFSFQVQTLVLSWYLKIQYSEAEVFTLYASLFSHNDIVGLNNFSLSQFKKPVSQLSDVETAELAVYLKSPNYFIKHSKRMVNLRDHILDQYNKNKLQDTQQKL
ncbi:MAG: transglycosylase domain-containing protein [Cellvibrio sp.]|nr:transglycosylase domain-containing protein [Cellvibrio sp.]